MGLAARSIFQKKQAGLSSVQKQVVKTIARRQVARKNEVKFTDLHVSTAVGSAALSAHNLVNITQGDAYNERIGMQISPLEVTLRGTITVNATATRNVVRLIIFRWQIDNAVSVPSTAGLFEDSASSVWLSPYKHDIRQFIPLFDKIYVVDTVGTPIQEFVIDLKQNLKTMCGYTAGANTGTNQLYVGLVSDQNVNTPTVTFHASVRYTD